MEEIVFQFTQCDFYRYNWFLASLFMTLGEDMEVDRIQKNIQHLNIETEDVYSKLGSSFPSLQAVLRDSSESSLPSLKTQLTALSDSFLSQSDSSTDFFSEWDSRNSSLFSTLSEKMTALNQINERVAEIRADSEELEIISLNAMVISIKSGEKGRAFSCITENLKKLSARMISLSNELIMNEKRLVDKNNELQRTVSSIIDTKNDSSKLSVLDTVPELQPCIIKAVNALDNMIEEAALIRSPIQEAMAGIQLQDIIKQSIDQIVLALGKISPVPSTATNEEKLDILTCNFELLETCIRIGEDIQKNFASSFIIFSDNWEKVHVILDSVEKKRLAFLSDFLAHNSFSATSLPTLLERMASSFLKYINQISIYQREQRRMVKDSSVIVGDVKHLRIIFDTIRPIISRLQHVRITQQIEVAKNPAISAVKDTVAHMSTIIMNSDARVQETRKEIETFISEIEKATDSFRLSSDSDQRELEKIKQERTSFFKTLQKHQEDLSSSILNLNVYPESFQTLCSNIDFFLESLQKNGSSFKENMKNIELLNQATRSERNVILKEIGRDSWSIKNTRLRDLVDRFTITSHKDAAASIGGFEVEITNLEDLESGEVTFF
ncbi:MAG TPA: hypothetical protein VJ861_09210 [Treponemataceae bacterium]|nr:hypothetical protein [Treponemataceae bacterium]